MIKWFLLLIFSLALFIVAVCYVLPNLFLKPNYAIKRIRDRGVRKIDELNGRSTIIYEPDVRFNNIIKQYILSDRGPTKILLCKMCYGIRFVDFDVVVFNQDNKVIKSINVKELIPKSGITSECELPDDTAYVTLLVNKANEKEYFNKITMPIPTKKIGLFSLITSILVLAEVFVLKWAISNIFGGVFSESVLTDGMSVLITFGIGIACAIINMFFCFVVITYKNKIVQKEGK